MNRKVDSRQVRHYWISPPLQDLQTEWQGAHLKVALFA